MQTNIGGSTTLPLGDALKLAAAIVWQRRSAVQQEEYPVVEYPTFDDPDDEDDRNASLPFALEAAKPIESTISTRLPAHGRISSRFGLRWHPIHKEVKQHAGVDIAAPVGTPIYSPGAGTASFVGWRSGYGKCITIDHGGGNETLYAHLNVVLVSMRQTVEFGDVIGQVGSTGKSTGPHVHYEVRRRGTPVDPLG